MSVAKKNKELQIEAFVDGFEFALVTSVRDVGKGKNEDLIREMSSQLRDGLESGDLSVERFKETTKLTLVKKGDDDEGQNTKE